MRDAPIRPGGATRQVATLHDLTRLARARSAQVDGEHGRAGERTAPLDELTDPELVCLDALPGIVGPPRALALRTHGVLPVVGAHVVAARVTHDGHVQTRERLDHVAAKPAR